MSRQAPADNPPFRIGSGINARHLDNSDPARDAEVFRHLEAYEAPDTTARRGLLSSPLPYLATVGDGTQAEDTWLMPGRGGRVEPLGAAQVRRNLHGRIGLFQVSNVNLRDSR
jgi:hypothetical protein